MNGEYGEQIDSDESMRRAQLLAAVPGALVRFGREDSVTSLIVFARSRTSRLLRLPGTGSADPGVVQREVKPLQFATGLAWECPVIVFIQV